MARGLFSAEEPTGLAVRPRDFRPPDPGRGSQVLGGLFRFRGETLEVGPGGDPWRTASPSRDFASTLHGFSWAPDLIATGDDGVRETLRLWLEWRRQFGRANAFAWSGEALERRVFNLACAAPALLPLASEAEGAALVDGLARQAGQLLGDNAAPGRAAERAAVGALAGAALAGKAGDRLLDRALPLLTRRAPEAVLRDGVHASRSPERGLELLFDFLSLDDALSQRGVAAPVEVARAIDRLGAAVRFFTLGDGRLASFHGGEAGSKTRIAAALAVETAAAAPAKSAPYGGYQRMDGKAVQMLADVAAPAAAPWNDAACAQPAALAVSVDAQRLIVGSAWSATAPVDGGLRGPAGGSCLAIADEWPGQALKQSQRAGPAELLEGKPGEVTAERQETDEAIWLDISHGGWKRETGLDYRRRLYLDGALGEVRGEDVLTPVGGAGRMGRVELAVRFQLAPGVAASLANDRASVLLRPAGGHGWRLRSDAPSTRLEAGAVFEAGESRATQVLVLVGFVRFADGARIRWKLSRDES